MTARSFDETAAPPAALTAFLRGVERRGAVFAQLLSGSPQRGDESLVATVRAFRALVGTTPFTEWPRRFWSLLLASPKLRTSPPDAAWQAEFVALAALGRGPRAALLLRLVAGLGEADAAAVLGVARPTYRLALLRALPHRADGTPDVDTWKALSEAAQTAVRQLPAERLSEIGRQREAAVLGLKAKPAARLKPVVDVPGRQSRLARWVVVAMTVLVLAATWWWPGMGAGGPAPEGIETEPLPPAAEPKATYDADARLLTHRDFELLLADEEAPAAVDPGFYAWYAAQIEQARPENDADPLPLGDAAAPLTSEAEPDAADAEVNDAPG